MRSDIILNRTPSGIGRAITLRLATAEHHIYAGVRRPVDAPKSPPTSSGQLTPLLLDGGDAAPIRTAADAVARHTSTAGLHFLVNHAGVDASGPLELIPLRQVHLPERRW